MYQDQTPNLNLALWIPILIILLSSCQNSVATYIDYFNENQVSLTQRHSSLKWDYELKFYSPEYMAIQEFYQKGEPVDDLNSLVNEYSGVEYYKLILHSKSRIKKEEILSLFPFKFQNQIGLLIAQDTVSPLMYHYEASLAGQNLHTFLLAFEPNRFDRKVVIKDLENKSVELVIYQSEISKIPKLNL